MSIQFIQPYFIQFERHTFIQFNQPIFVQCSLIHLISETGTSKNKRVVLRNTPSAKKMAESEDMIDVCDDLGIEIFFFEHVLNRTEEILDENSIVSSEHRISTHVRNSPLGAARAKLLYC